MRLSCTDAMWAAGYLQRIHSNRHQHAIFSSSILKEWGGAISWKDVLPLADRSIHVEVGVQLVQILL